MKTATAFMFLSLALCYASAAHAVTFDWATVGNPGNAADKNYGNGGAFGAVADTYRISKHEVTNDQYAEFLNAVAATDNFGGTDPTLYNSSMDITQSGSSGSFSYAVNTGFGPNPVNNVSFFDSMRFVNWLENGQGSGSTESGVYTIDIDNGNNETRALGATFFIPSEDEWYKAAYYDPRSEAAGGPRFDDNYWLKPTRSDTSPTSEAPPGGTNSANWIGAVGDTTGVGAYPNSTSFYGTFDQGGNVKEWNECDPGFRGYRGAGWDFFFGMAASERNRVSAHSAFDDLGFRVASIFVLPGDFDGDGFVTGTDFLMWQQGESPIPLSQSDLAAWEANYGTVPIQPGDFDGNGEVNGFDFLEWQRNPSIGSLTDWEMNYGMVAPLSATSAAVPEPTTSALALAALCFVIGRRRAF